MEFSIKSANPEQQRSACIVIGVFEPRQLTPPAERVDRAAGGFLSAILKRGDMDGKAGTTLLLHDVPATQCERVLLVGLGKEKEFRDREYAAAIRCAIKALGETGATDSTLYLTEVAVKKRSAAWRIRQATIVAQETLYRFEQFKSRKKHDLPPLRELTFAVERRSELAAGKNALDQGLAIAAGVTLARTLGNLPGNVCTPAYLAETALQLAGDHELDCQVL